MSYTILTTIGAWAGAYAVVLLLGVLVTCVFRFFGNSVTARAISTLLFIPGVVVHEGGHALACLLTGKKIEGIHLGLNEGYVNFDPRTGARTPLASCLVAFAPLLSCGTIAIYLWRYVNETNPGMSLTQLVLFIYLIVAMLYAAVPSGQDCKVAFYAFGERPRVTLIEAVSLIWPLWLPDIIGTTGNIAFAVYFLGAVPTYLVLWLLFVFPRRELERGRLYNAGTLMPYDGTRDPVAGGMPLPLVPPLAIETAARVRPRLSRARALELAGVKLSRKERQLLEETA